MSVAMVENGIYSDYRSPLATRYVSKEMRYNFSDQQKFSTWRKLWIYLAKAEMLEECGTCDEAGNVEIKKDFLMPMKPRKCSARPKPKLTEKRSTPNNSLKSVPKTAPKSPDCPPNPCTLEQCQSDYLTWQTSFQMEHRNRTKQNVVQLLDVNGNSKTALDQYLHYENLKKNGVQNQLSVIIPLISSFLKKRKGPRTLKPDEARRQIVVENPPDAIFMNNYAGNCQYPPRDKKLVAETRNPNWNSADNVTSKVSRVLPMSDKNQRQIMPANNAGSMVNVPAGHAPVHPNQYPFANHVQYGNYYQNYTVGGMKQNDPTTSGHLACEIPGQCNAYDARPSSVYHQEPSRNNFSQQFCNVADSCVNLGYPYSTSNQECENRGFPELNNRIYYHTTEPQNACDIAYCDNEISRGSIFSSMQNFDDAYTYMAPRTSAMFRNDGIFRGNEQSNEYRV